MLLFRVILKLILAHEYADVENYKTALDTLEELESDIEQLEETDCNDFLFKDVSTALFNVMRTCKAHVLISKNDEKKARKVSILFSSAWNNQRVAIFVPFADTKENNRFGRFRYCQ